MDLGWELARRAGIEAVFLIQPDKRARRLFYAGRADGYMVVADTDIKGIVAKTSPIYRRHEYLWSLKSGERLDVLDDLKGKRVAIIQQYNYPKNLIHNGDLYIIHTPSIKSAVRMLMAGRVDVVVSTREVVETEADAEMLSASAEPVFSENAYIVFQDTAKGQMLAEKFSAALAAIHKDGTYRQLFSK